MIRRSLLTIVLAASSSCGTAAESLQCPDNAKMLKEYSIDSSSSNFLNAVFSEHCQQDSSRKFSGAGVGLQAVMKAIPVKFFGQYQSTDEGFSKFCKNYASVNYGAPASHAYKETISRRALETIDQCLALHMSNVMVTHQIVNA